jgi:hypothetical protein
LKRSRLVSRFIESLQSKQQAASNSNSNNTNIIMAATFMENLWNSVFTPGPTPTLLVATNATFLALQVVLALLLVATRSIHLLVLSVLSGGLWWAINWFAVELQKAEKAEEEAGRLRKRKTGLEEDTGKERETDDGEDEAEEETETETEVEGAKPPPLRRVNVRGGPAKIKAVMESAAAARGESSSATGATLQPSSQESDASKRRSLGDSIDAGSVSTDSEWEKVSDR